MDIVSGIVVSVLICLWVLRRQVKNRESSKRG